MALTSRATHVLQWDKEALEIGLCSEDVIDRAIAYLDLYYYNGMGGETLVSANRGKLRGTYG